MAEQLELTICEAEDKCKELQNALPRLKEMAGKAGGALLSENIGDKFLDQYDPTGLVDKLLADKEYAEKMYQEEAAKLELKHCGKK